MRTYWNMKKILLFFIALSALVSCSSEMDMEQVAVGYVQVSVETLTSTNTRALDKNTYDPKQLAVKIVNAAGEIVKQTTDYTQWKNLEMALPVGTYTITASSHGFDGNEAGFDIPYYSGSKTITVAKDTQQKVSLTCTLATVKVTVKFTDRFKAVFSAASVDVQPAQQGIGNLQWVMGQETKSGYLPVGNFSATVRVTSQKGNFESTKTFTGVQARDHYILTYDVNPSGNSQITIKADADGNKYTYTINMEAMEQVLLAVASKNEIDAGVWSTSAQVKGEVMGVENFSAAKAFFEYKADGQADFTRVQAVEGQSTADKHVLTAQLQNLAPGADYSYRLLYLDDDNTYKSAEVKFTTEKQEQLPYANFDTWCMDGKMAFPCEESDYKANGSWWDTSNKGATSISNSNTVGDDTVVYTEGGKSAKLSSIFAGVFGIGKFAAASLYAGKFNKLVGTSGAVLDWGRPFSSRPKSLQAYVQYATGTVNYVGSGTPADAGMVKNQSTDLFAAYAALVHIDEPNANGTAISVDNTNMSTFPDWKSDPRVVAYTELPKEESGSTDGQWKLINLQFNYYKTDVKPTHLILVFSSSRYGDYFTGSTKSILRIDDLKLNY